jgi:hypothetical protein
MFADYDTIDRLRWLLFHRGHGTTWLAKETNALTGADNAVTPQAVSNYLTRARTPSDSWLRAAAGALGCPDSWLLLPPAPVADAPAVAAAVCR